MHAEKEGLSSPTEVSVKLAGLEAKGTLSSTQTVSFQLTYKLAKLCFSYNTGQIPWLQLA